MTFDELVEPRGTGLLRLAVMLCGNPHDAADLLQATFLALWRHEERLRRADRPAAYARRALLNEFLGWRRRPLHREVPVDDLPETATPGPPGQPVAPGQDDGWALLSSLPRRERAVLALRYYEDLTDAEIAEVLGCGTSTVRSNAARALATLRATLVDQEVQR